MADCEREALMRKVQVFAFCEYDAMLYLDTHPDCKEGLAYFQNMNMQKQTAINEYENKYGPLSAQGNLSLQTWNWAEGPWPWQGV